MAMEVCVHHMLLGPLVGWVHFFPLKFSKIAFPIFVVGRFCEQGFGVDEAGSGPSGITLDSCRHG